MAKTQYADGSHLTPSLQASYWGINGATGHNHHGNDADGSCPKITLVNAVSDVTSGSFTMTVPVPFADAPTSQTAQYIRYLDFVTVFLPNSMFAHSTANDFFEVSPQAGTWPSDIVPVTGQLVGGVWLSTEDVAGTWKLGGMSVSSTASTNWVCYMPDASGALSAAGFGFSQASPKGLFNQQITWFVGA